MREKQLMLHGFELQDYEAEAVNFIQQNEPKEGYFVGFSGGKDSIITLDLVKRANVKYQAFYSCTGIDEVEIYQFIRKNYPEVTWLHPKTSFWQGIKKYGAPLVKYRWCCNTLKKEPAKKIPLKTRIMGIRAEESYKRAMRGRVSSFDGMNIFKPIFAWKEWQVWEYIEKYNLPYPSLYNTGNKRIGCIICPFMLGESENSQIRIAQSMRNYPQYWKIFEKLAKEWRETKHSHRLIEETTDNWYLHYLKGCPKRTQKIPLTLF